MLVRRLFIYMAIYCFSIRFL